METIEKMVHNFMNVVSEGFEHISQEFEEDKKYFFVFLDYLGFSNKVRKAIENDEWQKFCADMCILEYEIDSIIEKVKKWNVEVANIKKKLFSDSICLYWEIGDYIENRDNYLLEEKCQLLYGIMYVVSNIQASASIHNVLYRGGIAVGHYFEKDDITVSDALVKAHDIESTIKIPVIGIDESVWKELNIDARNKFIDYGCVCTEKGYDYIDYINVVLKNDIIRKIHAESIYLDNIKKTIISNWEDVLAREGKEMHSSLILKYKWLYNYYNEKCIAENKPNMCIGKEMIETIQNIENIE